MPSKSSQNSGGGNATTTSTKSAEQLKVNKWDGPTVRNTIDDAIRKIFNEKYDAWTERHALADGRLVLSSIAVAFAGFALIYDYIEPFPKSKPVLATCSITYFILMCVLQLYQWYVEKGTFYQGVEADPTARVSKRYWKWSSGIKKYDDKYTLEAEYTQDSRVGYIKVVKSIGFFIDDEGYVVIPVLEKELSHIISSVLRKEE